MNTYTTLSQDLESVKPDLETKINRALASCFDDRYVSFDGNEFYFSLAGGAAEFLERLHGLLTDAEKFELVTEWLVIGDRSQAVRIADSLTVPVTKTLHEEGLALAEKWLRSDEHQNFLCALRRCKAKALRNDHAYQSRKDMDVMDELFYQEFLKI